VGVREGQGEGEEDGDVVLYMQGVWVAHGWAKRRGSWLGHSLRRGRIGVSKKGAGEGEKDGHVVLSMQGGWVTGVSIKGA